jgi:hypothetical protein
MQTGWLPDTLSGRMVGDYMSTSFVNGKAFGVFAKANAPSGGLFDEAMYTTARGLALPVQILPLGDISGEFVSSAGEQPVPNAKSDHGPRQYYDQDNRIPIEPPPPPKN